MSLYIKMPINSDYLTFTITNIFYSIQSHESEISNQENRPLQLKEVYLSTILILGNPTLLPEIHLDGIKYYDLQATSTKLITRGLMEA